MTFTVVCSPHILALPRLKVLYWPRTERRRPAWALMIFAVELAENDYKEANMKAHRILALTAILASGFLSPQANAGVSVSVGEPGFFGHIEIGGLPRPPQLIFPQPVIIQPGRIGVAPAPVYLHVPPGHEKNWGKHCRMYNACGRPVYFVQDGWYNDEYVPEYRKKHGKGHDSDDDHGGKHGGKHHGKDKD